MDKMLYFSEIKGELYKNKSLAPLTWFKVGGPAEYLFIPKDKADLIRFLKKYPGDYPKTIVGAGSNILIREGGISGVVISMKNLNAIKSRFSQKWRKSPGNTRIYKKIGSCDTKYLLFQPYF